MKKASIYEYIGIAFIVIAVIMLVIGQYGFLIISLIIGLSFLVHGLSLASFGVKPKYKLQGVSLYGLPQGESQCLCKVYKDYISFVVNKNESMLGLNKMFFGVPGAIIASRPKVKNEYIVIINYVSNGENRAVAIAVDSMQKYDAENVAHYINKNTVKTANTIL